jgi:hypothetical protein
MVVLPGGTDDGWESTAMRTAASRLREASRRRVCAAASGVLRELRRARSLDVPAISFARMYAATARLRCSANASVQRGSRDADECVYRSAVIGLRAWVSSRVAVRDALACGGRGRGEGVREW